MVSRSLRAMLSLNESSRPACICASPKKHASYRDSCFLVAENMFFTVPFEFKQCRRSAKARFFLTLYDTNGFQRRLGARLKQANGHLPLGCGVHRADALVPHHGKARPFFAVDQNFARFNPLADG